MIQEYFTVAKSGSFLTIVYSHVLSTFTHTLMDTSQCSRRREEKEHDLIDSQKWRRIFLQADLSTYPTSTMQALQGTLQRNKHFSEDIYI